MSEAEAKFAELIFSSAIGLEAILFGVFGVLYSVYALYLTLVDEDEPFRPPICDTLKWICRILALLMICSAAEGGLTILWLTPDGCYESLLSIILVLPLVGMLVIALYMAFIAMD